MASVRNLRREAPALLKLTKQAFKFIRDNPSGPDEDRNALLAELREAIDRVEPPVFDERDTSVNLTMTNPTADAIVSILGEWAKHSRDDRVVLEAVNEGLRRTKQRAYLRLDLNHVILQRLHFLLRHNGGREQEKSFKRLSQELEENGLNKNPMEIIGRMGL